MRRKYTFDTGPKSLHLNISDAHPNVISGGSPGRMRRVANYLEPGYELIDHEERGLVTVHGFYKGVPITAFSTGMGSGSVSITMPEIIEACDQDDMNIIRVGTAGGTKKGLNVGDIVASTWYERGESTSDKIMYQGYQAETDRTMREALVAAVERSKHAYQKIIEGPTRTTDDIYFDAIETKKRIKQGTMGGVAAVSMEGSVYCAIRDRYNLEGYQIIAGELLVISDDLTHSGDLIDGTEFAKRGKEAEAVMIIAGLEALVALRNSKSR